MKLPISLALPVLLLAFLFGAGCHKQTSASSQQSMLKVDGDKVTFSEQAPQKKALTVETVESANLAVTHLTGRLYWNDNATVRIFTPVAGRVKDILVDLGENVGADCPLALIDSPDFGQALADARTAEGNLRLADKTLSRSQDLFQHGAAAQKDVENAEASYTGAASERDRARSRLKLFGGDESSTNQLYLLRTPLAGAVVEKNINPGQEVRADQMLANAAQLFAPLFVVSDPTKLWLQLDVSEMDIRNLQPGLKLKVFSRAFPDMVFEGSVSVIADSLDPGTRTVKVRCVVNNPQKLLKAEMYVTVDVLQDASKLARSGVVIPSKAIFMKNNQPFLFIEKSPGEYQRQLVKLGVEQDGKVWVFKGVDPGQRVVTEGCLLLEAVIEAADSSS